MKLLELINSELKYYSKFEKIFYPFVVFLILLVSFMANDSKIALLSAFCGITYTLFAGKGKIYCYYIGILGTAFYCYIAFKNGFYANFSLYLLYFLPLEIIGIFEWKKNLNKEKNEIIKSRLGLKNSVKYMFIAFFLVFILYIIYSRFEKMALFDSVIVALSLLGQYFTLKRFIEQWYIWFLVDFLSFIMWLSAFVKGSNCFNIVVMWFIYTILAVYFYIKWRRELNDNNS